MRPPLLAPLILALAAAPPLAAMDLQLDSVQKIWGEAPHSAFGDLLRHNGRWWCVFREGSGHIPKQLDGSDDGKIRVIVSPDGNQWKPAALIAKTGIDLRDPHISITRDGRMMIIAGGSRYKGSAYLGRRPQVAFSEDGFNWSAPQDVMEEGVWLWRVTWHDGQAWGVARYGSAGGEKPEHPRRANLVKSTDGVNWQIVARLKVPGADETTLRFLSDGTMVALMRRATAQDHSAEAWIGHARAPYTEWSWSPTSAYVGGPNFIVLPGDRMIAGGRYFAGGNRAIPRAGIGRMTLNGYNATLELPSSGDSSYPGFAWHKNRLWVMYYSSHDGKAQIYLAKVRVR
ncbi:MAG: exo-alpha-sialidase [Bryobacterales bacterium]|nr:exo-alpha-sialidase [Bryobacterales bacterium]